MPYTEMENTTWLKLSLISARAKREQEFQFMSLAHLLNEDFLKDCYRSMNRNKAVRIDGVSWKETQSVYTITCNVNYIEEPDVSRKAFGNKPGSIRVVEDPYVNL